MGKIAIVYWSGTGNTEAMANFVAEGAGGQADRCRELPCAGRRAGRGISTYKTAGDACHRPFYCLTFLPFHFGQLSPQGVLLHLLKGLFAQVVLHLAGVRRSHLRVDAQPDEKLGQQLVPLINTPRNLLPRGQGEIKPSLSISMYPLSRSFFMATLTLGLEKCSSLAMSMERTSPWRSCRLRMASR